MYKCPSCGDGLVFDPKSQKLQCPSCRNKYEPEDIKETLLDQAREVEKQQNEYKVISYKCSHCGAELLATDETITTFCSFCRTGTMLDRKIVSKRKPDSVIPFQKTKKECEQIYINKIKKAFFAPKNMIDTQEVSKIRGIYMPYWLYSFEKHGNVGASGSKFSHSSGNYDYYDDYSLSTNVDAEFSGITHDATADFSDRLSESIAPFSLKDKKDFSAAYLSGFYADNEDVKEEIYVSECKEIADDHVSKKLSKAKEYHKYGAKPKVVLSEKSAELALFPVYFLATKNKKGDRISYAVINGQTGKIAADIPIDFGKFAMFSLALAIPIFILLNMFLTISMPQLVTCSIVFNVISLIVLITQNNKIKDREEETDDKGLQHKHKNKNEKKTDDSKQDISWLKPLIGLLLTLLLFFLRPPQDIYYYITALVSICITILSFYNIIEKFNMLTTRKLPQLGKRGGDENA